MGRRVIVEDVSERTAALALQGPTSASVLRRVASADIDALRYFRVTPGTIAGCAVDISRTGYTGDLGYEIWMSRDDAIAVWDAIDRLLAEPETMGRMGQAARPRAQTQYSYDRLVDRLRPAAAGEFTAFAPLPPPQAPVGSRP